MLTRKRQAKTRIRIQVTVGNVVNDLPNRPATRPIRPFELIASQPSTALRRCPAEPPIPQSKPRVRHAESSRRTIRPIDSGDPCSRDQWNLVFQKAELAMTEECTLRTADIDAPNRCGFVLTPMCVESLGWSAIPKESRL